MDPHAYRRWTLVHRPLGLALLSLVTQLAPATHALACDVCAVYTATEQSETRTGPSLGLAMQYTHFGTLKDDGREVPNRAGESLDSVITQVVLGYQVTRRFGLQLNLPLVTREFERVHYGRRTRGNVAGPGDLTMLGRVLVHSVVTESSVFRFSLLGGLELPTGDSAFLGEELEEAHHAATRRLSPHHGLVPRHVEPDPPGDGGGTAHDASGVHGHDLALGSGSVDGIVGGELFWSWKRAFVTGALHYAIRTEGDFQYRFANELTWSGGPGAYALLADDYSLALQARISGETKGKDHQAGARLDDTAVTNLFLGPRVLFTWGTALSAEAAVELPVVQHETARQIVADYRVRAAALWRF
jgi:hypothetical protein